MTDSSQTIELAVEDITAPRTLGYVPSDLRTDSLISVVRMRLPAERFIEALAEVCKEIREAGSAEELFGESAFIMGLDRPYLMDELHAYADNVINIPEGLTNLIPASQAREWVSSMVARMAIHEVAASQGWDTFSITVGHSKVSAYIDDLLRLPPSPERQVHGVIPLLQGDSLIVPVFDEDLGSH